MRDRAHDPMPPLTTAGAPSTTDLSRPSTTTLTCRAPWSSSGRPYTPTSTPTNADGWSSMPTWSWAWIWTGHGPPCRRADRRPARRRPSRRRSPTSSRHGPRLGRLATLARADTLRADLERLGWVVTDGPYGTRISPRRRPRGTLASSGATPADPGCDPRPVSRISGCRTLLIAALSLAAAGLDPHVYNPGLPSVQAAVRARPELEQTLLIAAVIGALLLLVGGVLGDTDGRRRIQLTVLAASDRYQRQRPGHHRGAAVHRRPPGRPRSGQRHPPDRARRAWPSPTRASRGRRPSGSPTPPTVARWRPARY